MGKPRVEEGKRMGVKVTACVTQDQKRALVAWAYAHRMSESAALRHALWLLSRATPVENDERGSMGDKFTIGEVTFTLDGKYAEIMGKERVGLLRKFYLRESIAPYECWSDGYGAPAQKLTWDDVRWDTAGERVTGK